MNASAKIYVAGHRGLAGSAIARNLKKQGYTNIIVRTRQELDLLNATDTSKFFAAEKPEYVFLAAAKVGGIMANNDYPAEFIYENLTVQNNVISNAHTHGVKKLLFLGSSCIYPKLAPQPIKEEYFLSGPLEETNKAYAVAKIAGIAMCQAYRKQYGANFISVMPTNLYGPNDNFDLAKAHVLPAMVRKFHEAKSQKVREITFWGTGSAKREFLHVDDLADACVFLMNVYNSPEIINIGTGEDISIKELAEKIRKLVGYTGTLAWDASKPDGTPRKQLDVSKLHALGWKHTIQMEEGLASTYEWFKKNHE